MIDMETLDAATTRLNDAIREAQAYLISAGFHVRAQVPLTDNCQPDHIAFGKENGSWGLFLVTEGGTSPLLNAPRHVRVQAAACLPALHARLTVVRDEEAVTTGQAADTLLAWVREMRLKLER